MDSTGILIQTIALVILLIGSGFFSASETSLMSLSKIRIRHMQEEGVKGAKLVASLIEDSNKLLSTILVGNNVVNIAATSISTSLFMTLLGSNGVPVATAVMTVLVLLFGEITPKTIAANNSEKVAIFVSRPIKVIIFILKPVVWVFNLVTGVIFKILGVKDKSNQPYITEEELKTMVNVGHEEGVLEIEEREIISDEEIQQFNIKDYIREPFFTYEFKKITQLLEEMKIEKSQMAIVVDEYGGTAGLITIEDLVEVIVGDIEDEYDEEEEEIQVIKEDEYIVDGSIKITDVNELIGVRLESEEFDSIGGYIIGHLRRLPEENEVIEVDNIKFCIESLDKNRIKKVRIFT